MKPFRVKALTYSIFFIMISLASYIVVLSWIRNIRNINPLFETAEEDNAKLAYKYEVRLADLLNAVIDAAWYGSLEVVKVVRNGGHITIRSKGKTMEGAENYVTNADLNSHCVMWSMLKKKFPLLKIISEEMPTQGYCHEYFPKVPTPKKFSNLSNKNWDMMAPLEDIAVWIDPLDGTQEYTENLLNYVTTMACVAVKGIPTIGVIIKPFFNSTTHEASMTAFWGMSLEGRSRVYTNLGQNISYNNFSRKNKPIEFSRSHSGEIENMIRQAAADYPLKFVGGAGYKVLDLIYGQSRAYVHFSQINKWDVCAGNALLSCVKGGLMTNTEGEMIDFSADTPVTLNKGLIAVTGVEDYKWLFSVFNLGKIDIDFN